MKLAEALALRADAARRADQLRARVAASARYQEGETPAEDAAALLAEAGEVLTELESLIRRINRTNAATPCRTARSPMRSPAATYCGCATACSPRPRMPR